MKKNINHFKNLIIDEEKEISLFKKISKKKINILLNRIKKDVDNTYKYSLSNAIVSILPDFDNLEKSLNLSLENSNFSILSCKLKEILELFYNLFKKYHVTIINEINVVFDPRIHQAISISQSNTIKSNHIITIMQRGYKLHQRVLRPAMVIVSK